MKKLLALLLALPLGAMAGGFQINTQGQKALSLGGSLTGRAMDASVTFFNPGGLTFLESNSFTLGTTILTPKTSMLSEFNGSVDMESQTFTPIQFYGAYAINDKLSAGIALNNPFGLGTKWEDDWEGRFVSQEILLELFAVQPTISYKVTDKIGVGAGLVYSWGHAEVRKAIPVQSATIPFGQADLTGSGSGLGFSAGLYAQLTDDITAGFSYRSEVGLDLEDGEGKFTDIPLSLQTTFPAEADWNSAIDLPAVMSFSIAYDVSENVMAMVEANITQWSSYDSLIFDFGADSPYTSRQGRKYEDVVAVRAGVQYAQSEKLDLRVGFAYDQSPAPDGYVGPELPDANKFLITLGGTYDINEKFNVDLSYIYENAEERTGTQDESGFTGTYKTILNGFGVGVNYNF
ncbi:MAG: hypothetical protein HKN75_04735 [Bacteroidia bacterium]|nr:hypothetical protein [Bacteroidia bacterium]